MVSGLAFHSWSLGNVATHTSCVHYTCVNGALVCFKVACR